MDKRKCSYCKKKFTPIRWCHIYCSGYCKYKAALKRSRERGEIPSRLRLRFEILKRDNFTCQYCGRNPKEDSCKLMIDHIHPEIKGGKYLPNNLITSCEECNLGKGDVLLTYKEHKKEVSNV